MTTIEQSDAELAACARAGGNEGREAVGMLIERHKRLVYRLVRKVKAQPGIDRDDLIQVGLMALARAATKWNPARGFKFVTYAWRSVANSIQNQIRVEKRAGKVFAQKRHDEDREDILDAVANRPEPADHPELSEALNDLDPLSRAALRLRYGLEGNPLGVKVVGERLYLSCFTVNKVLANSLGVLRESIVVE